MARFQKIQVMLDLETMGVESNSVICSIGAVKFNVEDATMGEEFYCTINAESCVQHGLVFSKSTIEWWGKKENAEALKQLRKDNIPLPEALINFTRWFGTKSLPTWGNGAGFDNVLMDNAYKAVKLVRPWLPWDDRCYRTVKNLFTVVPPERAGTYHNALDDAKFQTEHLLSILKS